MWTRLHYVYPYPHVDDIIPLMAEGKILPYLDIPFQHASPRVLNLMKRPGAIEKTFERIQRDQRHGGVGGRGRAHSRIACAGSMRAARRAGASAASTPHTVASSAV